MALQNVRSLLWRGDDLGYGGGNSRELILPNTVAASARPTLLTQAFVMTYTVPFLGATVTLNLNGKNRLIVNRNSRFWLTVTGSPALANGVAPTALVSFPIAPLQMFFLPTNFVGPCYITANTTCAIPQPLVGSPGINVPQATTQHALTFDYVAEG